MDDLRRLLNSRAVSEGPATWKVIVYPDFMGIEARTAESSESPFEGWQLAEALVNDALALGYKLVHTCRIGVVGESDDVDETHKWRGSIDVLFVSNGKNGL